MTLRSQLAYVLRNTQPRVVIKSSTTDTSNTNPIVRFYQSGWMSFVSKAMGVEKNVVQDSVVGATIQGEAYIANGSHDFVYKDPIPDYSSIENCAYCDRKFSLTRMKHYCSICSTVFCRRDGYTPHRFSSCGIPGDCICKKCLSPEIIKHKVHKH